MKWLFNILTAATILSAILISIIVTVAAAKTLVEDKPIYVTLVPLAPFVDPAIDYSVEKLLYGISYIR